MKKEYILFIDSGVGGLSTLAETYKILPGNFIYFADNKNSPYGKHTKDEIYGFVKTIIDEVTEKYSVKIVVLACNTATTTSAEKLRKEFNNLFIVGTEPAIKLATSKGFKEVLCLSTPATAKQKKYQTLRKRLLKTGVHITSHGLVDLAKNIDEFSITHSFSARFHLLKNLYEIKKLSVTHDSIVLGCTHYCLIEDKIFQYTKMPVLSGNAGVAQRVFAMHSKFDKNPVLFNRNKTAVKFLFSSDSKSLKQNYIKIFKQILAKKQNVC